MLLLLDAIDKLLNLKTLFHQALNLNLHNLYRKIIFKILRLALALRVSVKSVRLEAGKLSFTHTKCF